MLKFAIIATAPKVPEATDVPGEPKVPEAPSVSAHTPPSTETVGAQIYADT